MKPLAQPQAAVHPFRGRAGKYARRETTQTKFVCTDRRAQQRTMARGYGPGGGLSTGRVDSSEMRA